MQILEPSCLWIAKIGSEERLRVNRLRIEVLSVSTTLVKLYEVLFPSLQQAAEAHTAINGSTAVALRLLVQSCRQMLDEGQRSGEKVYGLAEMELSFGT
jgi:hypothetical protein